MPATLAVSLELVLLQLASHLARAQKFAAAALLPVTCSSLFMAVFETYMVMLLQAK